MEKSKLIYFSLLGNNKKLAKERSVDKLVDVEEFASGGFLRVFQFFMGKEKLKKKVKLLNEKIRNYKNIIVYGPIWGGKPAPAVDALIRNLDVVNKSISFQFTYTQNYEDTEKYVKEVIFQNGGMINEIKFVQVGENRPTT